MANEAAMQIQIPGVNFEGMAQQAIAAKLTEALVGADETIRKIVVAAIATKVDSEGKVSNYNSYTNTPLIEWLAQDMIRKAALATLKTRIEAMQPAIEKAIEAEMKRSTKDIAKALASAFVERSKGQYGLTAEIKLKIASNRD